VDETGGTVAGPSWLHPGQGYRTLVVAHRGASAEGPENTLAAFRLALEQGAPAVECDVHLSADGFPVVIHDETVDRTTNGKGAVAALTRAALRRLDAGSWRGNRFAGEPIPTLEETLDLCAGRARLFIELKAGRAQEERVRLVDVTLEAVAGAPRTEVAVISFDPEVVALVARRRPDLPLGLLWGFRHPPLPKSLAALARLGRGPRAGSTREPSGCGAPGAPG
jgi:glycerophosphoryl diester phosphodiesterase